VLSDKDLAYLRKGGFPVSCKGVIGGWNATLRITVPTFTAWLVVFGPGSPAAQDLFVYPPKARARSRLGVTRRNATAGR
jgi:hypothetical protein